MREAGLALLNAAPLDALDARALATLRAEDRAVRVSGQLYAESELAVAAEARIVALIQASGSVSLTEVRDALGTGRKSAQALLEHLDAQRVTRRQPDDRRVLRAPSTPGGAS